MESSNGTAAGRPYPTSRRSAFTLVEILVVLAIIALLAALIFPVLATARGRARQAVCISNLRQIGLAVAMYGQDHDGCYPYAVDPVDRADPGLWSPFPAFAAAIPQLPSLQDVLQPYIHNQQIFACPADTGFDIDDFAHVTLDARPTCYEKFGISYCYRTEVAARRVTEAAISRPSQINLIMDAVGNWHGTLLPPAERYNTLMADGSVKNLSRTQADQCWATPLNAP